MARFWLTGQAMRCVGMLCGEWVALAGVVRRRCCAGRGTGFRGAAASSSTTCGCDMVSNRPFRVCPGVDARIRHSQCRWGRCGGWQETVRAVYRHRVCSQRKASPTTRPGTPVPAPGACNFVDVGDTPGYSWDGGPCHHPQSAGGAGRLAQETLPPAPGRRGGDHVRRSHAVRGSRLPVKHGPGRRSAAGRAGRSAPGRRPLASSTMSWKCGELWS